MTGADAMTTGDLGSLDSAKATIEKWAAKTIREQGGIYALVRAAWVVLKELQRLELAASPAESRAPSFDIETPARPAAPRTPVHHPTCNREIMRAADDSAAYLSEPCTCGAAAPRTPADVEAERFGPETDTHEDRGYPAPEENIHCPVCGYYCLGKGGIGCIDKPSIVSAAIRSRKEQAAAPRTPVEDNEPIPATRDEYGRVLCCHGRPITCLECGEDYAAEITKKP